MKPSARATRWRTCARNAPSACHSARTARAPKSATARSRCEAPACIASSACNALRCSRSSRPTARRLTAGRGRPSNNPAAASNAGNCPRRCVVKGTVTTKGAPLDSPASRRKRACRGPMETLRTASAPAINCLSPGTRHRSKTLCAEAANTPPSQRARRTRKSTSSSPSQDGCTSRASRAGSAATSQAPALQLPIGPAPSPLLPAASVGRVPPQVFPGKRRPVQFQQVQVGASRAPGRSGRVGRGMNRHGTHSVRRRRQAAAGPGLARGFARHGARSAHDPTRQPCFARVGLNPPVRTEAQVPLDEQPGSRARLTQPSSGHP